MKSIFHSQRIGLIVFSVAVLTACGDTKEKNPGQSLVSINGSDITILQLNGELRGLELSAAADPEEIKKQALESLIDRQLLVDQALREKIDRDPEVMQQLERSRAQVLSQAYLRKRVSASVAPTQAAIDEYYLKHPELFAKRKLFEMRQISLAATDFKDDVKTFVENAKSFEEVVAWLEARGVTHTTGRTSKTTADLPPQLVANLDSLATGKPFILRDPSQVIVAQLNFIKDMPVRREDAAQQIAQFLGNTNLRNAVNDELARLRKDSKIVYLHEQSQVAGTRATPPAATAQSVSTTKSDGDIDRGVAGLK